MSDVKVEESLFGKLSAEHELTKVKKFTLTNKNDFSLSLLSYGAAVQAIWVKDKMGKLTNVVLGFDTLEDYTNNSVNPYFGATIGRVTNRISNGQFKLDGKVFNLDKNNGNSCLHGGLQGLSRKNWSSSIIENGVKFAYVSEDGESGFPGEVWFEVTYKLDPNVNKISIDMKAITDQLTPINLTHHSYFNLSGHNSGHKIYDHHVKLFSDAYLDFNPDDITVTGKVNQVTSNSKYDFREYVRLADRIKNEIKWPEEGYDNFFVLKETEGDNRHVASVKNPANGIKLDVFSNQNGVHFYTGNYLNVKKSSNDETYKIHQGFCLEAHNYPDSVNITSFPTCILDPADEYVSKIVLHFSIE